MANGIIKWVGGKRQLAPKIADLFAERGKSQCYGRYYEPFFGSGAVYFEMFQRGLFNGHSSGVLSDINSRLMGMWLEVMANPDRVADWLERLHPFGWPEMSHEARTFYYNGIRDEANAGNVEGGFAHAAAAFIWLNRSCFNGLYRENKEGVFNASVGDGKCKMPTRDDLNRHSQMLRKAHIMHRNALVSVLNETRAGDWVYLDPPYLETFDRYSEDGFGLKQHEILASQAAQAAKRGVLVIASNTDNEKVRELWSGFEVAWAGSMSNRVKPDSKTRRDELLLVSR